MTHMVQAAVPSLRVVLPTAAVRPVTRNGGLRTNAWFDLEGRQDRADEPCTGIEDSHALVRELLAKEAALLGASPGMVPGLFLGGFSQGGALALYTAAQELEFRCVWREGTGVATGHDTTTAFPLGPRGS